MNFEKFKDYKRAFCIGDTHLGVRNGSVEWLDIMKEYFYGFFIPLLRKESRPGDFLIHVGDVFDSRHSLNLLIMNEGMDIFEQIAKIMPVVIILGNHDVYKRNTNDVNSVKILKWIPNITVFEEPEVIQVQDSKLLFMPCRANHEAELLCVKNNPADYLFCHTDVQGLNFNRNTKIETGISLDELKTFKKIYSGHIHYSQHKHNFRMLGCPYPLTRSDVNNKKGIWVYDFVKEKETFYENTFSPKFMRYQFEHILEMDESEVKKIFDNNFVDLVVDSKWTLNFPFSTFSDDFKGYRKLEFIPKLVETDEDTEMSESDEESTLERVDILELSKRLIENTSHSQAIKDKLISTIKTIYDKVVKTETIEDE